MVNYTAADQYIMKSTISSQFSRMKVLWLDEDSKASSLSEGILTVNECS